MWMTAHDIICLLPMTAGGPAYMMKFPRNEGGLSQALQLLQKRKEEILTPLEAKPLYDPPKHPPQVRLTKTQTRLYSETTEAQRENARKVVAKLGIKS
jgi:hypothetical protein